MPLQILISVCMALGIKNKCCVLPEVNFYFQEIIMNALMNFIKDEDGLTAIEYVIAAALLVLGLTTLFQGYGPALAAKLTAILATF